MFLGSKPDAWIAEGAMDIDRIFEGTNELLSGFGFNTSEVETEIRLKFDALCSDSNGNSRLTETASGPSFTAAGEFPGP